MGINANVKDMIQALANNDIARAKHCALAVLANDKTASTSWWRDEMSNMLLNQSAQDSIENIPRQIQGLVFAEDVSETFLPNRYYVSSQEGALLELIKRMHSAATILDGLRINYLNSTLLYGVSGTGKTMFGRKVAHEFGLPFVYLNFSSIVDSHLGATSKNIAAVFDWVRTFPCVFMLDEIDSVSTNRSVESSSSSAGKELSRITITLIQELDRIPNNVILLAATNRLDCVDDAVIRRFQHKHEMHTFDRQDTANMIEVYLDDVGLDYDRDSVSDYVGSIICKSTPQALIVSHVVRSIANACIDDDVVRL